MTRKVLVTGGAGYIGSQTCAELAASGFIPLVLDDLSTGHEDNVRWGPLFKGDFSNSALVSQVIQQHRPLGVIHFAASAYVGESVENPGKYFVNNTAKSAMLIDTLLRNQVDNFIFSSSCATYGSPEAELISEGTPQEPINPYGQSKLLVEMMLRSTASVSKLKYVALRYFNAAGANVDLGLFERHSPETHLLPILLKSAVSGGNFTINGGDYATPDGTAVRDFIHIKDLAKAHVVALDYLLDGGSSQAMNLGTGTGVSIQDLIEELVKRNYKFGTEVGPRREGDPPRLVADAALAQDLLGWKPVHSNIETILGDMLVGFEAK